MILHPGIDHPVDPSYSKSHISYPCYRYASPTRYPWCQWSQYLQRCRILFICRRRAGLLVWVLSLFVFSKITEQSARCHWPKGSLSLSDSLLWNRCWRWNVFRLGWMVLSARGWGNLWDFFWKKSYPILFQFFERCSFTCLRRWEKMGCLHHQNLPKKAQQSYLWEDLPLLAAFQTRNWIYLHSCQQSDRSWWYRVPPLCYYQS